jgi:SAM-dependent methyltransferase
MSRPLDDAASRDAWNRGAEAWQQFVRSGADYYRTLVHGPALLAACGVRPGEAALDLGCGEGYFARELARAGAHVTGIELSPALIEYARTEEARAPLGIRYVEASAAALDAHVAPGAFDLVSSCMALQDMSDAGAALRGAARALRADGRLVFSVPHPATETVFREWERDSAGRKQALRIDRYFDAGPAVCHWNMKRLAYSWETPFWRRTLEQWVDAIRAAGFVIEQLVEPHPDAALVALRPELEDCARVPYFLVFRLTLRR